MNSLDLFSQQPFTRCQIICRGNLNCLPIVMMGTSTIMHIIIRYKRYDQAALYKEDWLARANVRRYGSDGNRHVRRSASALASTCTWIAAGPLLVTMKACTRHLGLVFVPHLFLSSSNRFRSPPSAVCFRNHRCCRCTLSPHSSESISVKTLIFEFKYVLHFSHK